MPRDVGVGPSSNGTARKSSVDSDAIIVMGGAWLILRCDRVQPHPRHRHARLTLPRRSRTGTIRTQLINVPARIARSAKRLTLHLPQNWPWEPALEELLRHILHDPHSATA